MCQTLDLEHFSYAIAIILLISSIISPIATTIINNIHQSKQEKIKNYELAKRRALENYVESASKCSDTFSPAIKENYIKSANTLYLYFSKVPMGVDNLLEIKGRLFNEQLTRIIQDLSKQITKE